MTDGFEAETGRCLLGELKPNFALIIDFSDGQVNGKTSRTSFKLVREECAISGRSGGSKKTGFDSRVSPKAVVVLS